MKRYTDEPENPTAPSDSIEEQTVQTDNGAIDETTADESTILPEDEPVQQEDALQIEEEQAATSGQHASPPAHTTLFTRLSFGAVILLGAILRFVGLGNRPLHHDESLHGYFSMILLRNNIDNWSACFNAPPNTCYHYDPLTHGPFQFHIMALVYKISQFVGVPDHGINTTTVRIAAALAGTAIVALPYLLRDRLTPLGAWLACLLLAISPSMVYYSRFAREDIYMACFTLLLVVALARYLSTRKAGWLVTAALAFTLSYATKESTFFTIGIFGSFFGALAVWEIGKRYVSPLASEYTVDKQDIRWQQSMAPLALGAYVIIVGIVALLVLHWVKGISIFMSASKANTKIADDFVNQLKLNTERVIPWLGIVLALFVFYILFREYRKNDTTPQRGWLARFIDPERQPLLDTLVTMPWTHWFFAVISAWFVFLLLFTALFTYIPQGIGDGIWQGIYYWIGQQQVARGSQPWYYYFMLIPLYEQIGLVFGLVGIVRCLMRPTRFRLFLVFWLAANVVIYTWAGEKMPWLTIHMTMPMMILAAIGLEPLARRVIAIVKTWLPRAKADVYATPIVKLPSRTIASTTLGVIVVLFTLVLTLQNMIQVNYVHPADATREMLIYVQTTPNVNTVMSKIDQLDQQLYGGKHLIPIGVTGDAAWPYAWYLRNYTNVCYNYPTGCPFSPDKVPVVLTGGDDVPGMEAQYGPQYNYQEYEMRSQWDQGYMPPACVRQNPGDCTDPQPYVGVGPFLWMSYGNTPPKGAIFNPLLAAQHLWQWWWERRPFGGYDQGYQMILFIRKGINVSP